MENKGNWMVTWLGSNGLLTDKFKDCSVVVKDEILWFYNDDGLLVAIFNDWYNVLSINEGDI